MVIEVRVFVHIAGIFFQFYSCYLCIHTSRRVSRIANTIRPRTLRCEMAIARSFSTLLKVISGTFDDFLGGILKKITLFTV